MQLKYQLSKDIMNPQFKIWSQKKRANYIQTVKVFI